MNDDDKSEEYVLWQVLKTCRENRGLSQRAAAALVQVSQPVLNEWESGRGAISEATLIKVARAYGVSVRDLLLEGFGEHPPARAKRRGRTTPSDDAPYVPGGGRGAKKSLAR